MDATYLQAIVLGIVQGITEMLPISSSGHLILFPRLLGWDDQGLAFDAALHVGTLVAVLLYFHADLWRMFTAGLASVFRGRHTPDSRLAWAVVLGTVPVGVAGVLLKDTIEHAFRNPLLVAGNLALWFSGPKELFEKHQALFKPMGKSLLYVSDDLGAAKLVKNAMAMLAAVQVPAVQSADVVMIALHGTYGEDGVIQAALELAGVSG